MIYVLIVYCCVCVTVMVTVDVSYYVGVATVVVLLCCERTVRHYC